MDGHVQRKEVGWSHAENGGWMVMTRGWRMAMCCGRHKGSRLKEDMDTHGLV